MAKEAEVKIGRNDISIDQNGNVVIKNAELKKRAEALLKDKSMTVEQSLALDNCDCRC